MTEHNLIRVIKRAERERSEQQPAGDTELGAREQARAMVATVERWVGESRRTRETLYREGRQQFGWPEDAGESPERELVRVSRECEE